MALSPTSAAAANAAAEMLRTVASAAGTTAGAGQMSGEASSAMRALESRLRNAAERVDGFARATGPSFSFEKFLTGPTPNNSPVVSLTIALWQTVTDWRNDVDKDNSAESVGKKFVAAIVYLITPILAIIEAVFRAIVMVLLSPGLFLLLKDKADMSQSDKEFLAFWTSVGMIGALANITAGTGLVAANYLNFSEAVMPNHQQIAKVMCPCING